MKNILLLSGLLLCLSLNAQILEIPTLKSKGINAKATMMEVSQFDYVKDKGLTLAQSDVETYDEKGRLVRIDRKVHSTELSYKYTYKLSKKGVLQEEKIVNATNNETVRTTTYTYKKSLLATTTQVQGTVTFEKNYSYNKNGHLIKMESIENGSPKGEEIYQVDEEGRRTRKSQKLPTEEVARMISSFTYTTEANLETKMEIRSVNGVNYKILSIKNLETQRNLEETTINLSDSKTGFNRLFYADDEKGSWVKGEITDNQFGRSRLTLRKITYSDGISAGRIEMMPEDNRARYFRQNGKFQVLINGKIATTGAAMDIFDSKDRLAYNALHNAWVLMKGYDAESYQTTWHEGQIVTNTKDVVIWVHNSKGIEMYQNGKKLKSSALSTIGDYSEYIVANTRLVYFGGDLKRSMVVRGIDKTTDLGKVKIAELTEEHNYWAKSSDTTYVAVGYGKALTISGQAEDGSGNNLVTVRVGDDSYFYLLTKFSEGFGNSKPGDVFPAIYLQEPRKELSEGGVYDADFSSFKYDNLKNRQYSLKTIDGLAIHGLAMPTAKTSDDQLIAYFPLTKQYLRMDDYYSVPDDQDFLDHSVTVLLENGRDGYYLSNEAKSIAFYKIGEKIDAYNYGSHKLDPNASTYGAVVYDSANKTTYGMNYDLSAGDGMGHMNRLPINRSGIYLLKLEGERWVAFQRGGKLGNYDYTAINDGNAYYFFKDVGTGKIAGFKFEAYTDAKPGDFISGVGLTDKQATELSAKLKVNPLKPIVKEEVLKGEPKSYKRDGKSYWIYDQNGEVIENYLEWFGDLGTEDVYAQDTALDITYRMVDYTTKEQIEGKWEIAIEPDDNMAMKWGEGNVAFFLNGKVQTDVKRVYINNSKDAEIWSELVYDPTTQSTYKMSYPSKEGFYLGKGELLLTGDEAVVLTKLKDGQFSIVRFGNLDKRDSFKSDLFEGDLIYWTEDADAIRYRFKGFENAKTYDLFYPEVLSASQLEEIKAKVK